MTPHPFGQNTRFWNQSYIVLYDDSVKQCGVKLVCLAGVLHGMVLSQAMLQAGTATNIKRYYELSYVCPFSNSEKSRQSSWLQQD